MDRSRFHLLAIVSLVFTSYFGRSTFAQDAEFFGLNDFHSTVRINFGLAQGASLKSYSMTFWSFGTEFEILAEKEVQDYLELDAKIVPSIVALCQRAEREANELGYHLVNDHFVDRPAIGRTIASKREAYANELRTSLSDAQIKKLERLCDRYSLYSVGLNRWVRLKSERKGLPFPLLAFQERTETVSKLNHKWEKRLAEQTMRRCLRPLTDSQIQLLEEELQLDIDDLLFEEVLADLCRCTNLDVLSKAEVTQASEGSIIDLFGNIKSVVIHPLLGCQDSRNPSAMPATTKATNLARLLLADRNDNLRKLCGEGFITELAKLANEQTLEKTSIRNSVDQQKREGVANSRIYEYIRMRSIDAGERFGKRYLVEFGEADLSALRSEMQRSVLVSSGVLCNLVHNGTLKNVGISDEQREQILAAITNQLDRVREQLKVQELENLEQFNDLLAKELKLELEELIIKFPPFVYAIPSLLVRSESAGFIKWR